MAKYKLKALSVTIGGKAHYKKEGEIFDTDTKYKGLKVDVEAAFKAGFLEKIESEKVIEPKKSKK